MRISLMFGFMLVALVGCGQEAEPEMSAGELLELITSTTGGQCHANNQEDRPCRFLIVPTGDPDVFTVMLGLQALADPHAPAEVFQSPNVITWNIVTGEVKQK